MGNSNFLAIFLTGLFTGGLTCMAVQGGLLATTIAQREEDRLKQKTKQSGNAVSIVAFLLAKLIAYTVFGFILGWLGSLVKLSLSFQVALQFLVAFFMIGTALNLLHLHPIFRYFIIQPPRFLSRLVRKQSKRKDIFAPALLGAFTVFIPCGTTQAMMALAIASGKPVIGAVILFSFILGTSPIFFILGYLATRLGESLHSRFTKVAASVILLLAIFNMNNAIALSGSRYTIGNILEAINCEISFCKEDLNMPSRNMSPVSAMTIHLSDAGYAPNKFMVRKGSTVTLTLVNEQGRGCIQGFTIPRLGIQKVVPTGTIQTITFTAPNESGNVTFTCSMGMYPGTIVVI